MARYSIAGQDTGTATTTILYVVNGASAPRAIALYDILIGSDATPADQASEFAVRNVTDEHATPGGTATTPVNLVRNGPAALSNGVANPTNEPTYGDTTSFLNIALNQRATFRWVAAPGSELVCDDAEDNGWSLFVVGTTSAYNVNTTLLYEE